MSAAAERFAARYGITTGPSLAVGGGGSIDAPTGPDLAADTPHDRPAPLPDPSDFPAMARYCAAQAAFALDGYVPPPQPGEFPEAGTPLRERLDRHLAMVQRGLLGVRQADPYDWEMERLFCRLCRGEAPDGGT